MERVPELVVQKQLGTRNATGDLFRHPYRRKNILPAAYDQCRGVDLTQFRQCIVVNAGSRLSFQSVQWLRKWIKCIHTTAILEVLVLFRIVP
ncbi:hypothetical protein D3C87_1902290 [compost metagenome]